MTKITRAPCRRHNGGAVPRAESFGDLITADHKVLSDTCESRNNHRYAVVVQDLATQWIQAYPCKNKTSQETQRSLQKFLEPERKPKVIYTDNSLEFGKACEDLSWNHCTSTPHRSETNGIAERAVRRVKEGTSAVLLQSGLNESWWTDSMECYTYLRNVTDLLSDGKTPYERRFGPSGRMSRWPCKDYLRATCNNSFCGKWHPPECLYYKTKSGCRFGEKCSFAHRQVDEQPTKRSKTNDDKSAVAILKKENWQEREFVADGCHDRPGNPGKRSDKKLGQNSSKHQFSDARQLGCVFQDMTPPKSILRKCTDMPRPIQRVKFTKAIARHTKIRDQNPSLGYSCPGEPHERSPNPKFEDRSQEETEWQEQGAREAAWKLAKNVFKLKEHERATFFSSPENRCLPASSLKPEEREFVVDSGASMHMISKKDLSEAEMDTLTKSCSPTIVITANGEVQTHEEAIVYVKELDIFLTMKVLENTPAVLSLGKLCDEKRVFLRMDQWSKTTSH